MYEMKQISTGLDRAANTRCDDCGRVSNCYVLTERALDRQAYWSGMGDAQADLMEIMG